MVCDICKTKNDLQIHHDSYKPEITRLLCKSCHTTLHGHGTGSIRGHGLESPIKRLVVVIDEDLKYRLSRTAIEESTTIKEKVTNILDNALPVYEAIQ